MPLRVAAYCRVSTDHEDQANSLHSQQTYFRTYIQSREDWLLAEVYADEGISGTSTRKREAFNRMVRDAQAGRFDLILTKEVSRFARNTVDTLEYTRTLKQLGVGVIFINDNIDTRQNDGEFRLTIMGSMAQEESRKTSERVKWGQKRRMEAGVVFGNDTTYGFRTHKGRLSIKEDEAAVVRRIYHKFLNEGKGTHVIARELYEEGVTPPKSTTGMWSCAMVRRILRNEKYVGDLLQKKFVTLDFLTHKKEENKGREEQVYLRDHHAAIVPREIWDKTQAELVRRNARQAGGARYSGRYWCSGKIRCAGCGSRFVLRKTIRPNGDVYKTWCCHSRAHYGNRKENGQGDVVGCNMRMVNDKSLTACARFVLEQLDLDRDALARQLAEDIQRVQSVETDDHAQARLEAKRREVARKKESVLDAYFSGTISQDDMVRMNQRYDEQQESLDAQLRQAVRAAEVRQAQCLGSEELIQMIRESLDTSEEVYGEAIEHVTVYPDCITIQVRFLPFAFKLWYTTSGRGDAYTTTVDKFELTTPEAACS